MKRAVLAVVLCFGSAAGALGYPAASSAPAAQPGVAPAASAAPVAPTPGADRFGKMDSNGDGKLVWEEFELALPQMRRPAFDSIDSDKSGDISRAEWEAFRTNHGAGMAPAAKPAPQAAPQNPPLIQPPAKPAP